MRRRRLLGLFGTAITGGLAGCIGGDGGGEGTTGTDAGTERSPTATSEATTTTTRTTTGTETETKTEPRTETGTRTGTTTATDADGRTTAATTSEGTSTEQGNGGAQGSRTVEVGPGGRYVFVPGTDEPLEIAAGETVEWVWRSDLHNIVVDSQPAEADWEGTPGGASKTYNTGYSYTHTFEVPGEYRYWCSPHRSLGMVADVLVTEP